MEKTTLKKWELELLEDSSEHDEWKKLRQKVHQAELEVLDMQNELDDFERDWSIEMEREYGSRGERSYLRK